MLRWCVAVSLMLAGCAHKGDPKDPTQSAAVQTKRKPIVALVPLIDSSHSGLNWNLSVELTQAVRDYLQQKKNLYLIGEDKIAASAKKMQQTNDPFGANIGWTKRLFTQNEFVVFMELVEHDEVPLYSSKESSPQESPAQLNMTVRLRVVDLRGNEPKVILQELVHDMHHIPKQFNKTNFYQVPWGNEMFDISPLGMAHAQLTKELTARIEDYILLAGVR